MKNLHRFNVCSIVLGTLLTMSSICFAQDDDDSYGAITSNAGEGKVEWTNVEPDDGPAVATVIKDAKKLFSKEIKNKNLPPVKSFFVKAYNGSRFRAESFQPIDHTRVVLVGLTGSVDAEKNYYLYNCEIEYSRPIGAKAWTMVAANGYRSYLSDVPKSDVPDNEEKSQKKPEEQKPKTKALLDGAKSKFGF